MVDGTKQTFAVAGSAGLPGGDEDFIRGQNDVLAPLERIGRRDAGNATIERRTQAVDIGPGPEPIAFFPIILFYRRVTGRKHGRKGLRFFAQGLTSESEVEEHGASVLAKDDTGRRNVAMEKPASCIFQSIQDRDQELEKLTLFSVHVLEDGMQAFTLLVGHDHVSGIVCDENVEHPYDIGMLTFASLRASS